MSNSQEYTLDDFLSDESFRRWMRSGDFRCADAEWSVWLAEHPGKAETVRQAQRLLLAAFQEEEIPDAAEIEAFVDQTWQRLRRDETPVVPLWRRSAFRVAAAVAVLVLSGLGWWRWQPDNPPGTPAGSVATAVSPEPGWLTRANDSANPLVVALEDGSSVVLGPGSRLRFPKKMARAKREVYLEGEGFFEVTKNPAQPFFVYANGLTTRVVGTSFRVRAFAAEGDVTVLVKTGRVAVYGGQRRPDGSARGGSDPTGRQGAELVLLPAQRAVFRRAENQLVRVQPEPITPQTLAVERQSFEFSDAPVPQILRAIETAYGIRITYDEAALSRCQLTTSLADEPLYQKLTILCEALGNSSHYEVRDGQIVLHSRGCD